MEIRTTTRAPISGIEVFPAIVREGSLRAVARSLGVCAPDIARGQADGSIILLPR